jgi:hypothetical protein
LRRRIVVLDLEIQHLYRQLLAFCFDKSDGVFTDAFASGIF